MRQIVIVIYTIVLKKENYTQFRSDYSFIIYQIEFSNLAISDITIYTDSQATIWVLSSRNIRYDVVRHFERFSTNNMNLYCFWILAEYMYSALDFEKFFNYSRTICGTIMLGESIYNIKIVVCETILTVNGHNNSRYFSKKLPLCVDYIYKLVQWKLTTMN